MKTTMRTYIPERDYMRIRRFLIDTFSLYGHPFNWTIDRWNFCRFHVIPVHNYYNINYFNVPTRPHMNIRDELTYWEKTIGIWENNKNDIVGVVHSENEEPGEAWIQIHPNYTFLYEEMINFIEERLADRVDGVGFVKLYVNKGCELEKVASRRGYRRLNNFMPYLKYDISKENPVSPQLPTGFTIKSVDEEDNLDKRRKVKGISFGGNYAPSQWPPASAYREMQKAPDYNKNLDLFIVGPDGDYVSFCTIWLDRENKYGMFEPVGTHVEYQGMRLAAELLKEGLRRMSHYGIEKTYMNSNTTFYKKFGFKETEYGYYPWIKYFNDFDKNKSMSI